MKKEIKTDNGTHIYEEVELFAGRKILNPEHCKNNLLDYKKVMDKHNISYGLMFGTLLGAIREGGFIKWDEDVDVFSLEEDRIKMLNALTDFEEYGFKIARYKEESKKGHFFLSLIRDNDYIDTYFYHKVFNNRIWNDNSVPAKYLDNTETIEFLGEAFEVPLRPKEVLTHIYGKDWNIPNKDGKTVNYSAEKRIKNFFSKNFSYPYQLGKMILGKK